MTRVAPADLVEVEEVAVEEEVPPVFCADPEAEEPVEVLGVDGVVVAGELPLEPVEVEPEAGVEPALVGEGEMESVLVLQLGPPLSTVTVADCAWVPVLSLRVKIRPVFGGKLTSQVKLVPVYEPGKLRMAGAVGSLPGRMDKK